FQRGVETAHLGRTLPAQHAVGADHGLGPRAERIVDDEEMIAVGIELVDVALLGHDAGRGARLHLVEENAVAQRERRVALVPGLGKAHLELARALVENAVLGRRRLRQVLAPAPARPKLGLLVLAFPDLTDGCDREPPRLPEQAQHARAPSAPAPLTPSN